VYGQVERTVRRSKPVGRVVRSVSLDSRCSRIHRLRSSALPSLLPTLERLKAFSIASTRTKPYRASVEVSSSQPLAALVDRQRGWKATRAVAPTLWLATATVEHPIKKWFRRRRPFISLIAAIIVGRKPGSYPFPSGHSAAAFAGALLLAREYPGNAHGFFGLASLVAFSRVYLGVHYPGDVLCGSLLGRRPQRGARSSVVITDMWRVVIPFIYQDIDLYYPL
jgi:hypothetical protein